MSNVCETLATGYDTADTVELGEEGPIGPGRPLRMTHVTRMLLRGRKNKVRWYRVKRPYK